MQTLKLRDIAIEALAADVEEPCLWLLYRSNLIKGKKHNYKTVWLRHVQQAWPDSCSQLDNNHATGVYFH
jgi:hypothetical protein